MKEPMSDDITMGTDGVLSTIPFSTFYKCVGD